MTLWMNNSPWMKRKVCGRPMGSGAERAFPPQATWGLEELRLRLPVDVYSTPDKIVVMAALPGLKPEEVEITLEEGLLTIKGTLPPLLDDVEYLIQERPHHTFSRTLQLNVPVDEERVEAHFENGLLTLTLPKAEQSRPKIIKIQTA